MKFTDTEIGIAWSYCNTIVEHQEALMKMYGFEKTPDDTSLQLAAVNELVGEMFPEITCAHKFYGKTKTNNFDKALGEFVDVLHFEASRRVLVQARLNDACVGYDIETPRYEFPPVCIRKFDNGFQAAGRLLTQMMKCLNDDDPNLWSIGKSLHHLFMVGARFFGITPDQLLIAYLTKNRQNQARAKANAASDDVTSLKASERPVYDIMYDNGYFVETADEFNARLTKEYSRVDK